MSKLLIRPFEEGDLHACMQAFISNVPEYFTKDEISDFEKFLHKYVDAKQHQLNNYATYYFVGEIHSNIIACGGFGDRYLDGNLSLTWGLVHADFHKKGFGIELLAYRLKCIRELYPDQSVYIDTTQNSAGFFEKYGFKTIAIIPNFYSQGLDRYDMVWDAKEILI